jgi:phosphate-selective porin OprO and OprP
MRSELIHAVLALLVVVCPASAQDVVQPTGAGQVDRKESEKDREKDPEKEAGKPAQEVGKEGRKRKEHDWGFRWSDHPSLRLGPGTRVDFRLRLQGDLQDSEASRTDDDVDGSAIDVARRRIGIDGEILNVFDYQVEREIGDDRDPWRDVYVNYKRYGFAQIQVGKFKVPFSLDENTGPTNLDFVYRSRIAALLAPGRDRGAMVHGRVLQRGVLRYELGAFHEDGSNARTFDTDRVHGGRTLAGRVLVQPFRSTTSLASDLAIGVAIATSDVPEGFSDLRGRTELDASFYRPTFLVNGQRRRIGFEARWRPGPFSIKSEYIRLTDERLGQSVEDTDLSPFVAAGWYVSGTWALTGEKKAEGLDSPRHPIFQGGVGAIELAVRVERIRFGSVADVLASDAPRAEVILGNSDRAYTIGVNWYANRWIKIQANLVRNTIAFPDQNPTLSPNTFWSRLVRFQFSM